MDSFKFSLFLATYALIAVLCVNGRFTTPSFQPRTIPRDACGTAAAMLDNCFNFTDFIDGSVPAADPRFYISCNDGMPICMECPGGLFFSEKCQSCQYNQDDSLNVCPPVQRAEPVSTATALQAPNCQQAFDRTFCNTRTDGNFRHPTLNYCYYSCYSGASTLMSCATVFLIYDPSCDACVTEIHNAGGTQ